MKKSRLKTVDAPEPNLGWTYLSREHLARAKAQMDKEAEGVRDEVGFLTIHQGYADLFFPGTSVLHTRARYLLFVPWLIEDLSPLTGPSAKRALQEKERVLAGRLRNASNENKPDRIGTIGGGIFPNPSAQPPSTAYWNALATWGILRPRVDGRAISRAQAHKLVSVTRSTIDDDGQLLAEFEPPFVNMPPRPENWTEGSISLRLEHVEATFIRKHLVSLRPRGRAELSLLARLAKLEVTPPNEMFDDAVLETAGGDRAALIRAQQAAYLSGIGRAVYDALLEIIVEQTDKRSKSTRHRDHLAKMVDDFGELASKLDISGLENDIGALPKYLHAVIKATKTWLISGGGEPNVLFDVYNAAEARKGTRARLAPTLDGRLRRAEWSIDEHGLAGVLHYRWSQVRTLLTDIAEAS